MRIAIFFAKDSQSSAVTNNEIFIKISLTIVFFARLLYPGQDVKGDYRKK